MTSLGSAEFQISASIDSLARDLQQADRLIEQYYRKWQDSLKLPISTTPNTGSGGGSAPNNRVAQQQQLNEQRLYYQQLSQTQRAAAQQQSQQQRAAIQKVSQEQSQEQRAAAQRASQEQRVITQQRLNEQRIALAQELNELAAARRQQAAQERQTRRSQQNPSQAFESQIAGQIDRFRQANPVVATVETGLRNLGTAAGIASAAFAGFAALGFVVSGLASVGKEAVETAGKVEALQIRIQQGSGSVYGGASRVQTVIGDADRLGISRIGALETESSISASTQGTDLEGKTSQKIADQINKISRDRALNKQQSDGFRIAIQQTLSKSRVSAEEINQLSESGGITEARSAAARSLGFSLQQFTAQAEGSTGIDPRKLIPAFLNQLDASGLQTQKQVGDSQQNKLVGLSAAQERLSSTVGSGLSPAYKAGIDLLTTSIDLLKTGIEIGSKVLVGFAIASIPLAIDGLLKLDITALATTGSLSKISSVLTTVGAAAGKLAILFAIGAAFEYLTERSKNSAQGFIDQSNAIKNLVDSIEGLNATPVKPLPKTARDIQPDEKDFGGRVKTFVERNIIRNIVAPSFEQIYDENGKYKGVKSERFQDSFQKAENERLEVDKIRRTVYTDSVLPAIQKAKGDTSQIADIDIESAKIDTQRKALSISSPQDVAGIQAFNERQQKLSDERTTKAKPIQFAQQAIEQQLKSETDRQKELIDLRNKGQISQVEYDKASAEVTANIQQYKQDQTDLNKSLRTSLDYTEAWTNKLAVVGASYRAIGIEIDKTRNQQLQSIIVAEQQGKITRGGARGAEDNNELTALKANLVKVQSEARDRLLSVQAQKNFSTILSANGLDINSSKSVEFQTKADQQSGTGNDKAVLAATAEAKKLQESATELETQIAQQTRKTTREIEDSTKSVDDLLRQMTATTREVLFAGEKANIDLRNSPYKNKLTSSIKGFQDSLFGGLVDSISALLDDFANIGKAKIDYQSQLSELNKKYADTQEQLRVTKRDAYVSSSPEGGSFKSTGKFESPLAGVSLGQIANYKPIDKIQNFSAYRNRRGKGEDIHGAVDLDKRIGGGVGAVVTSSIDGTAVRIPLESGYGDGVIVTSADGKLEVRFNHLKPDSVTATTRSQYNKPFQVKAGQPLGQVTKLGSRARGADDHLDYSIKVDGKKVDPLEYIRSLGSGNSFGAESLRSTSSVGGFSPNSFIAASRVIADKEVNNPDARSGYFERQGGGKFSEAEARLGFPRSVPRSENIGRYQVNYDDYRTAQRIDPSIKGFTPADQDKILVTRLKQPGLPGRDKGYQALMELSEKPTLANFKRFLQDAGAEWESLRDGSIKYPGLNRKNKDGSLINYQAKFGRSPEILYRLYQTYLGQKESSQPISPIDRSSSLAQQQQSESNIKTVDNVIGQADDNFQRDTQRTTAQYNDAQKRAYEQAFAAARKIRGQIKQTSIDTSIQTRASQRADIDILRTIGYKTPEQKNIIALEDNRRLYEDRLTKATTEVDKYETAIDQANSFAKVSSDIAKDTSRSPQERSNFKGIADTFKGYLPGYQNALKQAQKQVESNRRLANLTAKDINAKFGDTQLKNTIDAVTNNNKITTAELQAKKTTAENFTAFRPGDFSQGDPVKIQSEIDKLAAQDRFGAARSSAINFKQEGRSSKGETPEQTYKTSIAKANKTYQQELKNIEVSTVQSIANRTAELKKLGIDTESKATQLSSNIFSERAGLGQFGREFGDPLQNKYSADLGQIQTAYAQQQFELEELARKQTNNTPKIKAIISELNKERDLKIQRLNQQLAREKEDRELAATAALNQSRSSVLAAVGSNLSAGGFTTRAETVSDARSRLEAGERLATSQTEIGRRFKSGAIDESQRDREIAEAQLVRDESIAAIATARKERSEKLQFTTGQSASQKGIDSLAAKTDGRKALGLDTRDSDLVLAVANQSKAYQQELFDLEEQLKSSLGDDVATKNIERTIELLKEVNNVKLDNIKQQFDPLNQALGDTQKATRSVFGDLARGNKTDLLSIPRAFVNNVLDRQLDKLSTSLFEPLYRPGSESPALGGDLKNPRRTGPLEFISDTLGFSAKGSGVASQMPTIANPLPVVVTNQPLINPLSAASKSLDIGLNNPVIPPSATQLLEQSGTKAGENLLASVTQAASTLAAGGGVAGNLITQGLGLVGQSLGIGGKGQDSPFGGLLLQGLGSIFGFAEGGIVPASSTAELRKGDNPIAKALRKEGSSGVIIAATPGERVLSLGETNYYNKMFPNGILGYATGGMVGQQPSLSMPNYRMPSRGNLTSIAKIDVNVNGNSAMPDYGSENAIKMLGAFEKLAESTFYRQFNQMERTKGY